MLNIEIKPLAAKTNVVKDDSVAKYNLENATVTVADNKLILSKDAITALEACAGDRIYINYWSVDNKTTFPVIYKDDCGNRLTKSNTVSFRGMQREILLMYGSNFKITPFKSYYKMEKIEITSENENLEEEERDLNNLN